MELKDSQTFKNLQTAFEYEMISSTKYAIFSSKAYEDILIEISNIFKNFSTNSAFIGNHLRNILFEGEPTTIQNITDGIETESYADQNMYRNFANIALSEGFPNIEALFNGIANIKLNHSIILQSVSSNIQTDTLFCKSESSLWICNGCGNILSGICAPRICPICGVPQGYYQLLRYYGTRLS